MCNKYHVSGLTVECYNIRNEQRKINTGFINNFEVISQESVTSILSRFCIGTGLVLFQKFVAGRRELAIGVAGDFPEKVISWDLVNE